MCLYSVERLQPVLVFGELPLVTRSFFLARDEDPFFEHPPFSVLWELRQHEIEAESDTGAEDMLVSLVNESWTVVDPKEVVYYPRVSSFLKLPERRGRPIPWGRLKRKCT